MQHNEVCGGIVLIRLEKAEGKFQLLARQQCSVTVSSNNTEQTNSETLQCGPAIQECAHFFEQQSLGAVCTVKWFIQNQIEL